MPEVALRVVVSIRRQSLNLAQRKPLRNEGPWGPFRNPKNSQGFTRLDEVVYRRRGFKDFLKPRVAPEIPGFSRQKDPFFTCVGISEIGFAPHTTHRKSGGEVRLPQKKMVLETLVWTWVVSILNKKKFWPQVAPALVQ